MEARLAVPRDNGRVDEFVHLIARVTEAPSPQFGEPRRETPGQDERGRALSPL